MSIIRHAVRSAVILCAAAVGTPALATLLSTQAAALCFGLGCGAHFHAGLSPMFARRQTASSFAVPANQGVTRLRSTQNVSSVTAVRSALSSSKISLSKISPSKISPSKISSSKISSSGAHPGCPTCLTRFPQQNNDINPGGPSTGGLASPGGLAQGVPGANNTFSGGPAQAGGNSSAGSSGFPGGNLSSGLNAVTPASSGGGSGQLTSANAIAGNSSGTSRSLTGAGASNRGSTSGSGATSTVTTSNANTTTSALIAVTVCMTRAGSCSMERDVGTACQCKDTQGNVYDGIVK